MRSHIAPYTAWLLLGSCIVKVVIWGGLGCVIIPLPPSLWYTLYKTGNRASFNSIHLILDQVYDPRMQRTWFIWKVYKVIWWNIWKILTWVTKVGPQTNDKVAVPFPTICPNLLMLLSVWSMKATKPLWWQPHSLTAWQAPSIFEDPGTWFWLLRNSGRLCLFSRHFMTEDRDGQQFIYGGIWPTDNIEKLVTRLNWWKAER